jgi:hypothetical protein
MLANEQNLAVRFFSFTSFLPALWLQCLPFSPDTFVFGLSDCRSLTKHMSTDTEWPHQREI